MTTNPTPIDISNMPDLMRLAEEVEMTKKPRKLIKDKKTVAILMPTGTSLSPKKKRSKTKADYETFRAAFGSWSDVDTEALLKNIYTDRRQTNTRPLVKL
jgi:hypothetical protein